MSGNSLDTFKVQVFSKESRSLLPQSSSTAKANLERANRRLDSLINNGNIIKE